MIKLALMFFSFSTAYCAYAQKNAIHGVVLDENGSGLEFVNMGLYLDSVLISTCATNSDGEFRFVNLIRDEKYTIVARIVGYQEIRDEVFIVDSLKYLNYNMKLDTKILTEFTVKSKKPRIERKADRLIYYVEDSFVGGNNSALEVLKTVPSLWVEASGAMRINGRKGASVMVNGELVKMTNLQLQNYLNGIDGKDIIRIEVISIPGSEYDAQGNGGIINIEIKKKILEGYNARLFLAYEQGRYPEYNTGVFSNYKKGKFIVTANFYVFQKNNFANSKEERHNLQNTFNLSSKLFNKIKIDNNQIRLGFDYEVNTNQKVKFEYVRTRNINRSAINSVSILKNDQDGNNVSGSYETESQNTYNGISLNYNLNLDTMHSSLKVIFDFMDNDNITKGFFSSNYLQSNNSLLYNNTVRNKLSQLAGIVAAKIDYQKNYKNNNYFQYGAKYSYSEINNFAQEELKIDENFVLNNKRSTNFKYFEKIYATYLSYAGALSKNLQYKLGLRLEDAYVIGKSDKDNTNLFDIRYLNLFPSTYLVWDFGKNENSISLAFNRKINRPSFESLNPFEYVLNEFSLQRGNPNLKPELSTNLELDYTYASNYTLGLFYSNSNNVINNVLISNGKVSINETQNIASQNSYGSYVNFSTSLANKKIKNYFNVSLTNNRVTSNLVDESLATFSMRVNNNFVLGKNLTAGLSLSYMSKELYGNRIYSPNGQIDVGINKLFLDKRLALSLGARDIFNFQNANFFLVGSEQKIYYKEKYQSTKFQIFISYNFSSGKSFNKEKVESADSGANSRLKY